MSTSELSTWLKYASMQMASEAFLDRYLSDSMSLQQALTMGNDHSSKFTATLAGQFASKYEIIDHIPNTETGFSATLMQDTATNEYTISFRSTEFVDDVLADSVGTNEGIAEHGWAFGQIVDMEDWWARVKDLIPAGEPVTVTGYSLLAHSSSQ